MMRLLRGGRFLLWIPLLITLTIPATFANSCPEIDETGTVRRIIDGDTFYATPVGIVRLADIDTPEVSEPGAEDAADYLRSLVQNNVVYLDVDDLHGTDGFGRLVAVVYIRFNATHLLNVNNALLKAGLAVVADFANEFDPAAWTLYVCQPIELSHTVRTLAAAVYAAVIVTIVATSLTALLVVCVRGLNLN
ncbi:MAG: thermonuclease family protein [Thermoplasmata archaeon]